MMEEDRLQDDYYFQVIEEYRDNRLFVLIIYDIVDNKRRVKFAKLLQGYGVRVQKSAFEAMLPIRKYEKLLSEIPRYINKKEDNIRVYKISGKSQMLSWGVDKDWDIEDVILI